jgi:predicted ATPase
MNRRIRIQNFGPIKGGLEKGEWLDINKVTIFIGNQSSGKSTVAKVVSTLTWLEKALNRGDVKQSLSDDDFFELFEYQRINNYFRATTVIEYEGDILSFKYANRKFTLKLKDTSNSTYTVPKIMYVPAERNFLSAIDNPFSIKTLPGTLRTFAEELRKGQLQFRNKQLLLPLGNIKYKYNDNNDISYLIGDDYEVNMLEASSGYQSFVPLFLVTKFLSDELETLKNSNIEKNIKGLLSIEQDIRRDKEIAEINTLQLAREERNKKIDSINARYVNSCFINIVEEPEQNLFPTSQWQLLQNLLEYTNRYKDNRLIITTHSPYIINYLTLVVKAAQLKKKGCLNGLDEIISLDATISPDDLSIYELDENSGTITLLGNYDGLPSDENYLNEYLGKSNDLFVKLLKLEGQCR